jgi:predicted  nucleic acid-binding Zn-ribbon protein
MHPDLEKLIVLQKHDSEAKRLRDEMAALPKLVATLTAKLEALRGQRAVVAQLIAKEEAVRVKKQAEMATTTVQATAYEHEIAFAESKVSGIEDAELESLERSDALDAQKRLADAAVSEAEATLARESARANETVAADRKLLAEVEKLRAAERAQIGEAALSIYDRIAKAKGTAVSEALNQKCMACQMMVRPQRWNELRDRNNDDQMMTCESCGRLLYYDPARDSPQRKTVPVESIAAQIVRSL